MVRLESAGTVLDTFSDEPINLDINVQNNRDIGKIYAPISKTFTLPASDRNNEFFKHYYDVNVSGGFDAYSRTPCQLYVDSEQIFSGYLELLDCVIDHDSPKQYEVLVTSAFPSLAKALEGKRLDELSISGIPDSDYNRSNIVASWSGSLASGDIRYGLVGQRLMTNSQGSISNNLFVGQDTATFRTSDFYPYMRLSTIVKAIIEENGFRYSSTFLDSDSKLDKTYLLLGSNGGLLSEFDVFNARVIDVSGTSGTTLQPPLNPSPPDVPEARFTQLTFPTENEDPNSDYNTTNYSYTAPVGGLYKFKFRATFSNNSPVEIIALNRADVTGGVDPFSDILINPVNNAIYTVDFQGSSGERSAVLQWNFEAGTEYVFYARVSAGNASTSITDRRLTTIEVPYNPEGATLDFSDLLPDYGQIEFLAQVGKLYNLVFEPDRVDDKLIHITPWVDWIAAGSTFDLTKYVDQSKPINVKPTTELQGRSLGFFMEEGAGFYEERYVDQYKFPVGSIEVKDTGNEFADGEQNIETEFISSLMLRDTGSLVQWPQITDEDFEPVDFGLRLGMWNGAENLRYDYLDVTGTVTEYISGTVGFLPPYDSNEPTQTDFYLGFNSVVADGFENPLNNLFTEYWKEYIQNIYDKDSRLVTLEAVLPAHILNNIALNDQVLYKNQYYIIQSVKYNTSTNRAQFELLKAVATSPVICGLTPSSYNFRGVVTFTDADGNSTTTATKNCCSFYGFRYSKGKCYTKFDVRPPTNLANPLFNLPPTNAIGQVTGILDADLLVPVLTPTDGTVTYKTYPEIVGGQYGNPVLDASPTIDTGDSGTITAASDNMTYYAGAEYSEIRASLYNFTRTGMSVIGNLEQFCLTLSADQRDYLGINDTNLSASNIGTARVTGTLGGVDDGIYTCVYISVIFPTTSKTVTGIWLYNSGYSTGIYLKSDNFTSTTEVVYNINFAFNK